MPKEPLSATKNTGRTQFNIYLQNCPFGGNFYIHIYLIYIREILKSKNKSEHEMTNFQVEKAGTINIQARVSNPYGTDTVKLFENYEPQTQTQTQEIEDKKYQNLQKAESSYFMAQANLKNSYSVKQFNMIAKFNGYDKVNMTHRHDVA